MNQDPGFENREAVIFLEGDLLRLGLRPCTAWFALYSLPVVGEYCAHTLGKATLALQLPGNLANQITGDPELTGII